MSQALEECNDGVYRELEEAEARVKELEAQLAEANTRAGRAEERAYDFEQMAGEIRQAATQAVLDEMAGTWSADNPLHVRVAAQIAEAVLRQAALRSAAQEGE